MTQSKLAYLISKLKRTLVEVESEFESIMPTLTIDEANELRSSINAVENRVKVLSFVKPLFSTAKQN